MSKKLEILIQGRDELTPAAKSAQKSLDGLTESAQNADQKTGSLWKQIAGGAIVAGATAAAVKAAASAVVGFVKDSISAYSESEKSSAQLSATLKSTNHAAGLTAEQLKRMASELQNTTAFEDDAIVSAQSLLLTFTKIGGETFPRAQKAVLDMAQALGMDLPSAAQLAGKMLNDPVEGMALGVRYGIRFTETQKEMAKSMVESGNAAQAQSIILAELEKRFSGSSEAYAQTFGGLAEQVKNAWGDVQEDIGKGFADEFKPILEEVKKWIVDNKDTLIEMGRKGAEALGSLASALLELASPLTWTLDKLFWIIDKIKYVNPTVIVAEEIARVQELEKLPSLAKQSMQQVADVIADAQAKGLADAKSKETEYWNSVHELGQKLIKDRAAEREAEAKAREAEYKKEVSAIEDVLKQFYGVKESLVDQLRAHQANAEALGITGDMAERLAAAIKDAQFRQALEAMPKAAEKTSQKLYDMIPPIQRTYDFTERLKNPLGDVAEESERITSEWEKMSDALGGASEILNGMTDLFEGVGLSGLANITNQLSGISQGAASAFDSFASGDIIGGISQSLSTLGSVASFMGDIFGWNKSGVDDWVKQFDRLGVSISENIVEQIKEAKKAGEEASTAQAKLTAEIIQGGEVTAENMEGYKRLIQDVFMEFDNGRLSAVEATNEIGDAFVELANKAKEAGEAGSKALADIIGDARNRGMVSDDMQAWIDEARKAGTDALAGHIGGIATDQAGFDRAMRDTMAIFQSMRIDGKSSTEIIAALGDSIAALSDIAKNKGFEGMDGYLSELLGMKKFTEKNADVLDAMAQSQAVMESMANTGIMTDGRFQDAQDTMQMYYEQFLKNGSGEKAAIEAILPMLEKQMYYAEQYGYALDEETRKLIETAKAQGYQVEAAVPIEEQKLALMKMEVELMASLVEAVGGKLPEAFKKSTDAAAAFASQLGAAASFSDAIGESSGQKYFSGASGGAGKGIDAGFASGTNGLFVTAPSVFRFAENGPELLETRGRQIRATPINELPRNSAGGPREITIQLNLPNVRDPYSAKQFLEDLRLNRHGVRSAIEKVAN